MKPLGGVALGLLFLITLPLGRALALRLLREGQQARSFDFAAQPLAAS